MNFRVILLVLVVLVFTAGGTYINVHSFEESSLENTFNAGNLEIIQNTSAGTVPHIVQVKNTAKKPVKVDVGQIFGSNTAQDMVIAEEKVVNQDSSIYIRAYCYEPYQEAKPGEKLRPTGKASTELLDVINSANLADNNATLIAQLKIWIIASGDNLTTNKGEVQVLLGNYSYYQTQQLINQTRTNLAQNLNVTEEELKNIRPLSSVDLNPLNWIRGFFRWMNKAFNIS